MTTKTPIEFRVRNKGGQLAGRTLQCEIPEFDWATFKNLGNAEEFVRRQYYAAAKKLVREVCDGNLNGTDSHHLDTIETVVTRSLKFSKDEVLEWIETRDWSGEQFKVPQEDALKTIKRNLLSLTSPKTASITPNLREKLQLIISNVADKPSDAVADYLFSRLDEEYDIGDVL